MRIPTPFLILRRLRSMSNTLNTLLQSTQPFDALSYLDLGGGTSYYGVILGMPAWLCKKTMTVFGALFVMIELLVARCSFVPSVN